MKTQLIGDNPYAELICKHMYRQFPQVIHNSKTLLEILSDIFIGTKDNRYGSIPSPEFQVTMREAIKRAIDLGVPIPVLVPWGSIKSTFVDNIDIAELSAISQLNQLKLMVEQVYPIGLDMVVRIEDTSGLSLFQLEGNQETVAMGSELYSKSMQDMITIIGSDYKFRGVRESEMAETKRFDSLSKEYSEYLNEYLHDSKNLIHVSPSKVLELASYKTLQKFGWQGIISPEQREYYLNSYKKNYQDWDEDRLLQRLSLYFGGSLARHNLNMTGKQDYWDNKFIQLAFVPPISGLPEGYNKNYIYYRAVPNSQCRTHMPPWRAKGYLKITRESINNKIVSWYDPIVQELETAKIKLESDTESVIIQTDYLVED